jgi:hypothetical protein
LVGLRFFGDYSVLEKSWLGKRSVQLTENIQ